MPILVVKDKRYEFSFMCADFSAKEAMAIEKATGLTWQEFLEQAGVGVLATIALVWMCRRRGGEDVAFNDVDFAMGDISFELDAEQKRAVEDAAAAEAEAEAEADENPTPDGEPSGVGPEASPTPKPSTSSRSRKSSASTSGTSTA